MYLVCNMSRQAYVVWRYSDGTALCHHSRTRWLRGARGGAAREREGPPTELPPPFPSVAPPWECLGSCVRCSSQDATIATISLSLSYYARYSTKHFINYPLFFDKLLCHPEKEKKYSEPGAVWCGTNLSWTSLSYNINIEGSSINYVGMVW